MVKLFSGLACLTWNDFLTISFQHTSAGVCGEKIVERDSYKGDDTHYEDTKDDPQSGLHDLFS